MRRSLVAAAVAGVVALAGAVLVPSTAHAVGLTCEGGFGNQATGTYNNVLVPSDANGSNFCVLNGATVLGGVVVKPGGAVLIGNTTITNGLTSVSAGTGTGGNGLTFSLAMCGTTVDGKVSITRSASLVEVGTDDYTPCFDPQHTIPNTLNDTTNVSDNNGGVEVESNQVNADLTVNNNRGAIPTNRDFDASPGQTAAVNNNHDSTHRLTCLGNASIGVSSGNTFKSIVGQCGP